VTEYAVGIGPAKALVDQALVDAAHDRCLDVHPFTVDDPAEMTLLLDTGADGMFTNRPRVLRSTLDGRPVPPKHCPPRATTPARTPTG
jgi:glycerophosphoryl diester phosphodiesterase